MSKHKHKKHRKKSQHRKNTPVAPQKNENTTEFWVTMGLAVVAIVVGIIIGVSI